LQESRREETRDVVELGADFLAISGRMGMAHRWVLSWGPSLSLINWLCIAFPLFSAHLYLFQRFASCLFLETHKEMHAAGHFF
jgi:hypothetical protein